MMAAAETMERLIDRLPPVRGTYSEGYELARLTWFRVGGPAEVLYRPEDPEDLAAFLSAKPEDVPVTVIGIGANLLVRDGGVPGIVVRLGRSFATVETDRERATAGAGALGVNLAKACRDAGIAGLEFLAGVPGTIGGAIRMNAGAYESEIKDILTGVVAFDQCGRRHGLTRELLDLSYRHNDAPDDLIFVQACFRGRPGRADEIARQMAEISARREASQPIRTRTGGSTFMNPSGPHGDGPKAWELIEAAGCRGLRRRGAIVSEKHCNFLINTGNATAGDLETLGEEVRRRVFEHSSVTLEWEIRRIGVSARGAWA